MPHDPSELTYDEWRLLALLLDGPRADLDRTCERVLINSGLAERIAGGQIQLTSLGRYRAEGEARNLSTWLNSFRR